MTNPTYQWPRYKIADPSISGPLTVFPVINGNSAPDDYILLSEAVDKGIVKMSEKGGGTVPVILIENRGKAPVLGILGEEYVGAKQNRTLNVSFLAGPGKTEIPVSCVEAGRWSWRSGSFRRGSWDSSTLRAMKSSMMFENIVGGAPNKYASQQGKVWSEVARVAHMTGTSSPSSALSDVYENMHKRLDEIVDGIELPAETRGVVVAGGGRIIGADIFERPDAFGHMWPSLVKSYALDSLEAKGTPPSLEAADTFLHAPAGSDWVATPSVALGQDVRWEGKRFIAASLIWQDRHIHSSVFAC